MNLVRLCSTVNGEKREALVEPSETLLALLRFRLGLTGTKEGCGTGDCGACTVLLDGQAVVSCLVLAPEAENCSVVTIEGIAEDGHLHPLQRRLVEKAGLQCGICTPGFVVAAKALLDATPDPTEEEVRLRLAGNLCRCTGYDKIIAAVLAAADDLRAAAR